MRRTGVGARLLGCVCGSRVVANGRLRRRGRGGRRFSAIREPTAETRSGFLAHSRAPVIARSRRAT